MRTINYFLIGSSCFFVVMLNIDFMCIVGSSSWLEDKAKTPARKAEGMRPRRSARDEEAHRPPAESEALHGNQLRCHKQSSSCIQFVCL